MAELRTSAILLKMQCQVSECNDPKAEQEGTLTTSDGKMDDSLTFFQKNSYIKT